LRAIGPSGRPIDRLDGLPSPILLSCALCYACSFNRYSLPFLQSRFLETCCHSHQFACVLSRKTLVLMLRRAICR